MSGATMTWFSFGLILSGVLLNAAAQLFLKAGTNTLGVVSFSSADWFDQALRIGTNPHIIGGMFCYAFSLVVWIMALSRVPVSVAYPMLSIGYVVSAVAAYYLFGESLSVSRWLGIGFIIVGVYLVSRP
ncbi:MAG: SMR family transporter [Betaproteobacteria bacterium]